jgi:hypothetical protein
VKKQMEQMLQQSGLSMSPEMMGMMKNMDFSQDKVGRRCGAHPQRALPGGGWLRWRAHS